MKVLFVIDKLNTGGVSSSLLNLLKEMSGKEDCSLLVFSGKSVEKGKLPDKVNIIKSPSVLRILGMTQEETFHSSFFLGVFRLLLVVVSKILSGVIGRNILFLFVKKIKGYDVAISYTHDVGWKNLTTGCNQFVIDRVDAKQKVSFVHCDYSRYGGYSPKQVNTYKRFSHIICVSEACKQSFLECFPSLSNSARVLENFTDSEKILRMVPSAYEYNSNLCNIVTVCRLTEEKGLSRALDSFSKIIHDGITDFKWTIVGGGPDRIILEKRAKGLGLEEYINFVGESKNPFYYMKNATLFLLPSFHEAAPMVFGECKVLKIPILTTDTISARELVESRGAGFVCENSMEGIYYAVKDIILNRTELFSSLKKSEVEVADVNGNAIRQLNSLILDLYKGIDNRIYCK